MGSDEKEMLLYCGLPMTGQRAEMSTTCKFHKNYYATKKVAKEKRFKKKTSHNDYRISFSTYTEVLCRHFRGLVISAEGVRQTGVRIAEDIGTRAFADRFDEGSHLASAQCTVEAEAEEIISLDGTFEIFVKNVSKCRRRGYSDVLRLQRTLI